MVPDTRSSTEGSTAYNAESVSVSDRNSWLRDSGLQGAHDVAEWVFRPTF